MAAKKQSKLTRRAGNHFWKVKNLAGNDAELILYGTISDTSWWGDEITPKQFIDDIKSLGSVDTLTVRINSGGGDVFAAQAIGAQIDSLNKAGTETVCRIDGLCASAATIIAAHCKRTVANSDALYMIHLPSVCLWDACNENDLQAYLNELKAVKDSILQLYAKKTGKDMDVLTGWMEDTSWFTANEAKENGFIDEVDEDAEPALIENRAGALFVNSVNTGLCMNEAPDYVKSALRKQRRFSNTKDPADAPENKEEPNMAENKTTGAPAAPDITTVDALRTAYPDLCKQIENTAAQSAATAERARIKDIEDMTAPGDEQAAYDAKFGDKPQDAAAYAIACMKAQKAAGAKRMADANDDAAKSGVNGVKQEEPAGKPKDSGEDSAIACIRRANNVK